MQSALVATSSFRDIRSRDIIAFLFVFLAYFLSAKLGLYLFYTFHTSLAIIWPPVGVALAAVILGGYRMWLPIFLAQFFALFMSPGDSLVITFAAAAASALQPVAMTYVMKLFDFEPKLYYVRNVLIFGIVSLTLTTIAPAIIVVSQIPLHVFTVNPMTSFLRLWAAGVFSTLVITPFILTWYPWQSAPSSNKEKFEIVGALALLAATDFLLFWTHYPQFLGIIVIFLLPAALMWFALRFRIRWMTLGIFLTALIGIAGSIVAGVNMVSLNDQLLADEIYVGVFGVFFLIFTAIIEERRASVQGLKEALDRISKEDQAKNEFLATLAHELRNPLAPVVSSLEIMRLKAEATGQQDMVELADVANTHNHMISRLLDDLLDISRITQKKFKLQKGAVELQSVVIKAQQTVADFYKSQRHKISVSLPEAPLWIEVDPIRLQQIIVNLLHNAAKYTHPGGHVLLYAIYDPERGLRISVKDDGIGINANMLGKIFEPFTQLKDDAGGSGLGLGLSLSRYLVELHGGELWVESEGEGKGSEFIFVLPASVVVEAPAAAAGLRSKLSFAAKKPYAERRSILIVDDNEAAAKSLTMLLEHAGHSVSIVYNGQAALEHVRDNEPQIVLLDIGLPDIDGYTVGRKLRQEHGSNPLILIALTGYGQEEDKAKAREAGFNFHLTKPVSIEDINALLEGGSTPSQAKAFH